MGCQGLNFENEYGVHFDILNLCALVLRPSELEIGHSA